MGMKGAVKKSPALLFSTDPDKPEPGFFCCVAAKNDSRRDINGRLQINKKLFRRSIPLANKSSLKICAVPSCIITGYL